MNIHYDLIKKGLLQLIKVDCISLAMLSLIYMYKRNLNQIGQIVQMMHQILLILILFGSETQGCTVGVYVRRFNYGQSHCQANIMNTGGSIVIH